MKYLFVFIVTALFVCAMPSTTLAQDANNIVNESVLAEKLFSQINSKAATLNKKLMDHANGQLSRMEKEERKLRKKLAGIDSSAAREIFSDAAEKYSSFASQMAGKTNKARNIAVKYIPRLDSLQTALLYLGKQAAVFEKNPQAIMLMKQALTNINELQSKFDGAENIRQFVHLRSKFLAERLSAFGLSKDLKKLQKKAYYYQAQIASYKQDFNEPSSLEARALTILKNSNKFKKFFSEHSQLASLFRLPETSDPGSIAGFASLQTRGSVDEQLLQKFGSLPDFQQTATHQIKNGQNQLNELKNKLAGLGNSNEGADQQLPGFKPNNQKTKSFLNRIELGSNLQTTKSNTFFPSTSDLALSLGYKINDKSIAGIGGSYKMGWGRDIRHVSISHQGIGVRSFVDIKLKGNFWISGGAEMNYRSQFKNFEILDDYSPWQKSALLGLSKRYRISKKVKGNMQLLYNFLSSQQIPKTQPVVFRIGYIW